MSNFSSKLSCPVIWVFLICLNFKFLLMFYKREIMKLNNPDTKACYVRRVHKVRYIYIKYEIIVSYGLLANHIIFFDISDISMLKSCQRLI